MSDLANILTESFGVNEPIFTEEILGLFPAVTEMTVFNRLGSALKDGTLRKFRRGVYYVPDKTDPLGLGVGALSADKVIE
jgi:hypothetical protein